MEIRKRLMVPAHFHDVTNDKITISQIQFGKKYCRSHVNVFSATINAGNSYLG